MMKYIDYPLFKIVVFFKRKYIFIVWVISHYIIGILFDCYEILNNYEHNFYWYDFLNLMFFILTYLRAKWIINNLNKIDKYDSEDKF